jgi:CheY-like chemotaxis protein
LPCVAPSRPLGIFGEQRITEIGSKRFQGTKLAQINAIRQRHSRRGDGRLTQHVILVVDDERCMVDLIADVLESEGFAVKRARDGFEALKKIDQKRPDLVITDILMPGLDGISLARKILDRKQPIPMILMSASRRQLTEFDVPFLAKPFNIDDLVALARKQVEDSQQVAIAH